MSKIQATGELYIDLNFVIIILLLNFPFVSVVYEFGFFTFTVWCETVPQAVMDTLQGYYREFVAAEHIAYVKDMPAGHAMITDDYGGACGASEAPFINDCDFDAAGELLQHLYGPLDTPGEWRGAALHTFDQAEFVDDPQAHSMNALGHVYVPEACVARTRCRLHVALHGCHQYEGEIADAFYRSCRK